MLTSQEKNKIMTKYKLHDLDTGSPEIQIALFTEEIKKLIEQREKREQNPVRGFGG